MAVQSRARSTPARGTCCPANVDPRRVQVGRWRQRQRSPPRGRMHRLVAGQARWPRSSTPARTLCPRLAASSSPAPKKAPAPPSWGAPCHNGGQTVCRLRGAPDADPTAWSGAPRSAVTGGRRHAIAMPARFCANAGVTEHRHGSRRAPTGLAAPAAPAGRRHHGGSAMGSPGAGDAGRDTGRFETRRWHAIPDLLAPGGHPRPGRRRRPAPQARCGAILPPRQERNQPGGCTR